MKIIEQSVELVDIINGEEILRKLERCGRVSHKSKIGDAENFVRKIIKLGHESVLEHVQLTFKVICDRAIMAELTRHRHASFTVESTRYVKYDELKVINQFRNDVIGEALLRKLALQSESFYQDWFDLGATPEQPRSVLPLCLATELYMTANLRELRHILKLRTSKAAHPQMRTVAGQILEILRDRLPVIVEDITP